MPVVGSYLRFTNAVVKDKTRGPSTYRTDLAHSYWSFTSDWIRLAHTYRAWTDPLTRHRLISLEPPPGGLLF